MYANKFFKRILPIIGPKNKLPGTNVFIIFMIPYDDDNNFVYIQHYQVLEELYVSKEICDAVSVYIIPKEQLNSCVM